jgi:hypothetical protein
LKLAVIVFARSALSTELVNDPSLVRKIFF